MTQLARVGLVAPANLVLCKDAFCCCDYTALVRSVGGVMLTGEKRIICTETCPKGALSTTSLTCTGLGLNPGLPCGEAED